MASHADGPDGPGASGSAPDPSQIRTHLHEILASRPFEASKRCCQLLTYLVEKTLAGEADSLKERSLGEDVFGRAGYEPSEQNLVRVTANELRKRLAQFYETHVDSEIHVELSRGSYVPVFRLLRSPEPAGGRMDGPPAARRPWRRWRYAVLAALVALAAVAVWHWRPRQSAEVAFWQPVLSSGKPALIWANGWGLVASEQARDEITRHQDDKQPYTLRVLPGDIFAVDQMMSYGHVHGIGAIMSWLGQHNHPAELRLGNWSMPADAQDRPLIAFGALNNPWTVEMNRDLRFRVTGLLDQQAVVETRSPGRRWTIDWRHRGYDQSLDYGIVTRLIDPVNGQVRISIGGICNYSSQAGAELLTMPRYWAEIDKIAPRGWERMNMQVVFAVRVVAKIPERPSMVAWYFW
jgi:hypothetical protein